MKKIVISCILFLNCLGFSSFVFSAAGDIPLACKTLSHIYAISPHPAFSSPNMPIDLSSFSIAERIKIYNNIFSDAEITGNKCDEDLFEMYQDIEHFLSLYAEENKNTDDIRKAVSENIFLPGNCLKYRETYIQHMQPKLVGNKFGARWTNVDINDFVILIDVAMIKVKYNQSEEILNEYCDYANYVWQRDPNMTIKDYNSSKKKYPLTKYCESVFHEFEDIVFNDFYPEKDKRLDGMIALILRGKQIADPTASGLMEKRAWLSLLYKNNEGKMDNACRYDHLTK